MYKRYVDDSNQAAEVPPMDDLDVGIGEEEDARLARILRGIANRTMQGIEMEADFPSNNADGKMPVLDLKVWMDEDDNIRHQHYEKAVSSRDVLHSQSAQSSSCKRNVHTQEVLRRMLNTSPELDWKTYGAPVITDYMVRSG